jgi:hypothetical protein
MVKPSAAAEVAVPLKTAAEVQIFSGEIELL